MDSYVVRIYRRDEKTPGKVAGMVELIEQEQIKSFRCVEELVKILGLKEKRAPDIQRSKRKPAIQESIKHLKKKRRAHRKRYRANGQK